MTNSAPSPVHPDSAIDATPIGYTIVVDRTVEEAFDLFTLGIDRWWPRHRWLNLSPAADIRLDLAMGGAFFAQEPGGGVLHWGRVSGFTPYRDLTIQLLVDHEWQPLAGAHSTLDLTFRGEGDTRARVDLHHRDFHLLGERATTIRHGLAAPNGWPMVMKSFSNLARTA